MGHVEGHKNTHLGGSAQETSWPERQQTTCDHFGTWLRRAKRHGIRVYPCVCVCVCVCLVCMHICMYLCMYNTTSMRMRVYKNTHTHTYTQTRIHKHIYTCMYTCIYTYILYVSRMYKHEPFVLWWCNPTLVHKRLAQQRIKHKKYDLRPTLVPTIDMCMHDAYFGECSSCGEFCCVKGGESVKCSDT